MAAGNMEPEQCFGIVCTFGERPGRPGDVDHRQAGHVAERPSTARSCRTAGTRASRTWPPTARRRLTQLVFECRFDNTNPLAWEDCEYPAEYFNLSPGAHIFEVRAIDLLAELADPTPASTRGATTPLPSGIAPRRSST